MSVSADGYINRPDGSIDWTAPSEELHRFHNQRMVETDVQLLGRNLYETMLVWETEEFSEPAMAEFAELWRPLERVVFSNTLTSIEGSGRLATRSLEDEIAALGDRRIAVGGAGLAAECMRRGLIDDFQLFVVPIVIGGGTPYFPPDVRVGLELVETRTFGSTVHLRYRRV
jgi:dihydrofolate reductase